MKTRLMTALLPAALLSFPSAAQYENNIVYESDAEMYLSSERPTGIMDLGLDGSPSKILAYDLTGNLVWEGTDMAGLEQSGHKGIIIVTIENDNEVKVIKRFIK